jgi:ATP-dependent RNA helicase DDX55/SPB4
MALRFADVEPRLSSETLEAISRMGFSTMTPVQSAAIPLFLRNKDVSVEVRPKSDDACSCAGAF